MRKPPPNPRIIDYGVLGTCILSCTINGTECGDMMTCQPVNADLAVCTYPNTSEWTHHTSSAWSHHEIDYLAPPASRDAHAADSYIGSPSIVNTGGGWLASHDRFFHEAVGTTYVFGASSPNSSWSLKATVSPMYWAQLFINDGVPNAAVYLIGTSDDMSGSGDIVISRCIGTAADFCSGTNWTKPVSLFQGNRTVKYHAAPTPVVTGYNALYQAIRLRAFDVVQLPSGRMSVVMLSVFAQCPDLTEVSCWRMSDSMPFDPSWLPWAPQGHSRGFEWEEAGAIVDAAGNVSVMVRLDRVLDGCADLSACNQAVLLQYDIGTNSLAFNTLVAFPSGSNKFKIARRPAVGSTNDFYALTNPVTQVPVAEFPPGTGQRSLLLLAHSTDLHTWQSCAPVAFDDTNVRLPRPPFAVPLQTGALPSNPRLSPDSQCRIPAAWDCTDERCRVIDTHWPSVCRLGLRR